MIKMKYALLLTVIIPVCGMCTPVLDTIGLDISRMQFQAKQVIPPSPEAAELGKYGNVPVSLFTGSANVSVPLVHLKGNVLSVPVSLSYNSSGFKPEEIAPWTGLGWALNAGGVITRSALGEPDKEENYFKSPSPLRNVPTNEVEKQLYYEAIRTKEIETQPDIFFFNFMGRSGKFSLDTSGQIIRKEKDFLRISRLGPPNESSFVIYDDQGIKYEFEAVEETTISTLDEMPRVTTFISSWYLSKVTAPFGGEELEFDYYSPSIPQSTISGALSNQSVTFFLTNDGSAQWQLKPLGSSITPAPHPAISIKRKFLKRITLKKKGLAVGYIEFLSDLNARQDLADAAFNGERMLKAVELHQSYNGQDSVISKFEMQYGYFGEGQNSAPFTFKRLKLSSVREVSADTLLTPSKPPYTFEYFGELETMPARFTSGLDHWGYYNGALNFFAGQPNLVPTVPVLHEYLYGQHGLGANREANPLYAQFTMLSKLTYPTGGFTSFEYEANRVSTPYDLAQGYVGGLRLSKMIDHTDPDKPAIAKAYAYTKVDGSSSGQGTVKPVYHEVSDYTQRELCSTDHDRYSVTISASAVISLGSIQGSHIGYERVTEFQVRANDSLFLGKTVYEYDIQGFNEVDDKIGNGNLLKKSVYDASGKLLELVKHTYSYQYEYPGLAVRKIMPLPQQSSRKVLSSNPQGLYAYLDPNSCAENNGGYTAIMVVPTLYHFYENYLPTGTQQLLQEQSISFDVVTGDSMVSVKNYTYGNPLYNYPTLTEEVNSLNERIYTLIKRVGDYTISCGTPDAGSSAEAISQMQVYNMVTTPIETFRYITNDAGGNKRYIAGQYMDVYLGHPKKQYLLKVLPVVSSVTGSEASCATTPAIDTRYELEASMEYDTDMNLICETRQNDLTSTYLWGYDNRLPIAKIINATHGSVSYASFESNDSGNLTYSSGGLVSMPAVTGSKAYDLSAGSVQRSGLNSAQEYTITYWKYNASGGSVNIGGTELTSRNGWVLYRTNISGVSSLSISGNAVIDELRIYPAQAQMVTYTYNPMVGVTSECDVNNRVSYYEYDHLGRLIRVRDMDKNILRTYEYQYRGGK